MYVYYPNEGGRGRIRSGHRHWPTRGETKNKKRNRTSRCLFTADAEIDTPVAAKNPLLAHGLLARGAEGTRGCKKRGTTIGGR